MENDKKIAIKLIFNMLLDKKEHELYEFHYEKRLLPLIIFQAINFLEKHEIIRINGDNVILRENLSNEKIAIINRISKTFRPEKLYESNLDINSD